MESACPKCKKEIEHEDYLFEVTCSDCGSRFNPFYDQYSQGSEAKDLPSETDFTESTNAFKDIVTFAENLGEGLEPEASSLPEAPVKLEGFDPSQIDDPAPAIAVTPSDRHGEMFAMLMTSGDALHGYRIDTYFPPISVWTESDSQSENPLESGFKVLWERSVQKGANGTVAIQWRFTPDGNRILISGTPVRCEKE